MCTATLGATPVTACTCAASSIFSCGVRGTPGWANTLNLVPVLPNAHDGNSIRCARSAVLTAVRSGIPVISMRRDRDVQKSRWVLVQVEDLGDPAEALIGPQPAEISEIRLHLRLPAGVDAGLRHPLLRCREVVGLQVPDEQPVVGEEQRVVAPARLAQRVGHLRPDLPVPGPVLVQPV